MGALADLCLQERGIVEDNERLQESVASLIDEIHKDNNGIEEASRLRERRRSGLGKQTQRFMKSGRI